MKTLNSLKIVQLEELLEKNLSFGIKIIISDEISKRYRKFSLIGVVLFVSLISIVIGKTTTVEAKELNLVSIKQSLSLERCRTVQKEEEHIKKGQGSAYAMDIACKRGYSFEVFAPLWKNKYIVRAIGKDERLGNYIILKHGEYWFVFGHTKTNLKVGDKIIPGQKIGEVNKSGMSQNYHLHFELWKNDYNISYKEMLGEQISYNMEYTYRLRKQRGWFLGEKEAMDLISSFEGFSETAYCDNLVKVGKHFIKSCPTGKERFSIGFGTLSFKGEKITKEEAKRRKIEEVSAYMENIYKNHFVQFHNQRIALVSATYNLGKYSSITEVKNRKTEKGILQYFKKFNKTNGAISKSLENRREQEGKYYLNKL